MVVTVFEPRRHLLGHIVDRNTTEALRLIEAPGTNLEIKGSTGLTPLHWAARKKLPKIVQALVAKGVQIDPRDHDNCTPLHWAAQNGNLEVAQILLELGADANAKCASGRNPVALISPHWHDETFDFMAELSDLNVLPSNGYTTLILHVHARRADRVARLLKLGADPNLGRVEARRNSALHIAAANGSLKIVELLLEAGADPAIKNRSKSTPLMVAETNNHPRVAAAIRHHLALMALNDV